MLSYILISEPYILASDPEFSSLILLASISIALILSAVTVVSAYFCNFIRLIKFY